MSKTTKKDVVTQNESRDLVLDLPFDIGDDIGDGMEGADKDSFAIPFLRVLQKISPQCDEADAAYVEGAKGGMLYNSVTNQLYDGKEGVIFLPCAFQRRFLQWAPRGTEGGFRGELLPEQVAHMRDEGKIVELDGRLYIPDDNGEVSEKKSDRVVDTRSHFGLVVEEDSITQVLLTLASTQIKKSKQLMSILSAAKVKTAAGLVTPPTWMNQVRITTVLESNDQGSWYGVKFEPAGFVTSKEVYDAGKAFHEAISAGEAKANFAEAADAPANNTDKF